jgi:hypothetical protein
MATTPTPPMRYLGVIKRRRTNPDGIEYCIIKDLPGKNKRRQTQNGYFQIRFQPEDQQPLLRDGVRVSFEISPVSHKDNPEHTFEARKVRVADRTTEEPKITPAPPPTAPTRAARAAAGATILSPASNASVQIQPLQEVVDGCIIVHGSCYDFVATTDNAGQKFTCTYTGRVIIMDTRTKKVIREGGTVHEFRFGKKQRIAFTVFVKGMRADVDFAGPNGEPISSYALRCRSTVTEGACENA